MNRSESLTEYSLPVNLAGIAGGGRAAHAVRAAFTLAQPGSASKHLTFEQVDVLSDCFAAYLAKELELVPGDVVAIQMPNSLHYPIVAFGTWKAGAVLTNVNPLYTERELAAQLRDCHAKVLVTTAMAPAAVAALAEGCGVYVVLASLRDSFHVHSVEAPGNQAPDGEPAIPKSVAHCRFDAALQIGSKCGPVVHRRHSVALYQYTGGTTGRSKGAQLTHRNILSAIRMIEDFVAAHGAPFVSGDVILTVLPLYHVFAFVVNFLVFFHAGARNILIPSPRPLLNLRPAFDEFSPTWITGVDTLFAGLLAEPWFAENPPKLKFAISGGTALRPSTGANWRQSVCPMLEGYGMTETSGVVALCPPGAPVRAGSVGLPMPGSEVKVVDSEGRTLPPEHRGELWVRGPHIMSGYLNQAAEDAVVVDGWLRTGDVVVIADDGYITIVDRLKDMVLVSGFNVYPNEVEAVLAAHPDIAEVAVIGVPDETTGEAVCAFVVSRRPELTAAEVVQYCRTQLTAYKVPKQVVFRDLLPKSAVGKILRSQLRTT